MKEGFCLCGAIFLENVSSFWDDEYPKILWYFVFIN
jgi:hypothetical protein